MKTMLGTYVTVLLVMLVLDGLWLGVVAKPFYMQAIGHLMADVPRWGAALVFYAVFALGLTVFGVWSQIDTPGWVSALRVGAMFGFFCYATYDLTNLATLKDWPVGLSLLDMAWGTVISGVSAAAGKLALDKLSS